MLWDADDFGVGPVGGDAIARLEFLDTRADGEDRTGRGIAERQGFVELLKNLARGREEAIRSDLLEDTLDLVGLVLGLAEE
jgi:hypothetical protein